MDTSQLLSRGFSFDLGNLTFAPAYWQVGLIVFLLFLLVLMFAQVRRHMIDWSMKGAVFGIFFGFLLALVLEGFLVIGGKTALTQVLGWKDPPKPLANVLEMGRGKLVEVLGETSRIPDSSASEEVMGAKTEFSALKVIKDLQSLPPNEVAKAKQIICEQ